MKSNKRRNNSTVVCLILLIGVSTGPFSPLIPQGLAQTQQPNPHAGMHQSGSIIDGSKNPELIPDSVAYLMVFLHLSVPTNYTEADKRAQLAHVAKVGLPVADLQPFLVAMAEFRSQHDAWVARWNTQASMEGLNFDSTLLSKQREDFVQATRNNLQQSLSAVEMLKLDAFVQTEKRSITVHKGGK